jgi:UDP-N-acetylmuramyl pentapeptide phosphotransferase/UDP-N-acetylglucosamine-1-phosphate transferase
MLLWAPLFCVFVVSLLDDLYGLPAIVRLATHLIAASLVASSEIQSGAALIVLSTLTIGWMTNLYNFMDGSDGLAGGMTLFGFSFYGIAALLAGHMEFALLNFSIAAAAAGFLVFNFHPARIFMGDVGSVPLGFLAASLGLMGWRHGSWTWWFPLLVFSPFIVDASVTLARRLLHRERVWRAHRDHYYQRLVQMGWGHRNTAFAEYALMAVCGLCAVGSLFPPLGVQLALIAALAIAYVAFALAIDRAWRRFCASN